MKTLWPMLGGAAIGAVLTAIVGVLVVVIAAMSSRSDPNDARYQLLAVAWGTHSSEPAGEVRYQAQVIGEDNDEDGVFRVSARVCIWGGTQWHEVGEIGTAESRVEALRQFGTIKWTRDAITFGGEDGIRASLLRKDLEGHR